MQQASAISLTGLSKVYATGCAALSAIDLEIQQGEIFALLGANGAGKTTLIHAICGIVNPTAGSVRVAGMNVKDQPIAVRKKIGMVPQELTNDALERVEATVKFSRALHDKPGNPALVERILRDLSLWDVRKDRVMTLSGGMKRRVMIAKALVHEPDILFLDEPTAGVDVAARQAIWALIRTLRDSGVTIILTTHYIEEAESIADRIGVIQRGKILLVEPTHRLLERFGEQQLAIQLAAPLTVLPAGFARQGLQLTPDGRQLVYTYSAGNRQNQIADLLRFIHEHGIGVLDVQSRQRTLEEIFVNLINA